MEAKFVYEGIHFERNQEPMDVLKLGRRLASPELKKKYIELVNAVHLPRNVELQEGVSTDLLAWRPLRFRDSNGWGNMDQIIDKLTRDEYFDFEKIVMKYYNQLEK